MTFSDCGGSGKIVAAHKEERGTRLGGYPHFTKSWMAKSHLRGKIRDRTPLKRSRRGKIKKKKKWGCIW